MTNGNVGNAACVSPRASPVSTTVPPLRVIASASVSVRGLPTVSKTKSAPRPAVNSRIASAGFSGAGIVCVAPNRVAIASGAGRTSIATIVSQPAIAAPCTTLRPTPPAPMTTTREPGVTCAALVTAPTPVTTAQPTVASASKPTSDGTRITPSSGTIAKSEKHAVPRNGATAWSRARTCEAPDGRRFRYVTLSSRSHSTARPSRHGGQTPHGGAQQKTTWSSGLTLVTPGPTSRTMPAPSCPRTTGVFIGQSPRAGCRSL